MNITGSRNWSHHQIKYKIEKRNESDISTDLTEMWIKTNGVS